MSVSAIVCESLGTVPELLAAVSAIAPLSADVMDIFPYVVVKGNGFTSVKAINGQQTGVYTGKFNVWCAADTSETADDIANMVQEHLDGLISAIGSVYKLTYVGLVDRSEAVEFEDGEKAYAEVEMDFEFNAKKV